MTEQNLSAVPALRRVVGREPLLSATVTGPSATELLLRQQQMQLDRLTKQLAEREAQCAQLQQLIDIFPMREREAREFGRLEGRSEGMSAGLQEAQRDYLERNQAVTSGARKALSAFENLLTQLAPLATQIALVALERVLGASAERSVVVMQIVAQQLDLLRSAVPIEVRVAASDFTDDQALQIACRQAQINTVQVVRDSSLVSGSVIIQLQLGEIDASLEQQLSVLRRLLSGEDHAT